MTTSQISCLEPTAVTETTRPGRGTGDRILAFLLGDAFRELAKHSPAYAAVFATKPGVRLAAHIRAGQVRSVTARGREQMQSSLKQIEAALTIPPGLDTNQLLDSVTGRRTKR